MTRTRRQIITTGLGLAAGASGLAVTTKLGRHYGLIPPDASGIYGPGEALTYAAQRILTRHSLAREFAPSQVSNPPFANVVAPLGDTFKRLEEDRFREWRLAVDGMVAHPKSFSLDELRQAPNAKPDHASRV